MSQFRASDILFSPFLGLSFAMGTGAMTGAAYGFCILWMIMVPYCAAIGVVVHLVAGLVFLCICSGVRRVVVPNGVDLEGNVFPLVLKAICALIGAAIGLASYYAFDDNFVRNYATAANDPSVRKFLYAINGTSLAYIGAIGFHHRDTSRTNQMGCDSL